MHTLRSYQNHALDASVIRYKAGVTRQLIALPTGTGKTPLFASVRSRFGFTGRVMVLVHREELAQQAADKLRTWNPGESVGVEMADSVSMNIDAFVVASVQTIGRTGSTRIEKFDPFDFDAIICDEAHHSTATTYKNVFTHFGLLEPTNKKLLLGVTATPNRTDGQAMAEVYDEIVYQMTILEAMRQGWLVDLSGIRVSTGVDIGSVKVTAGDFNLGGLSEAVNTPERNLLVVKSWLKEGRDRQTVIFTVDIEHAQDLARLFRSQGILAEAIWGEDPERADKLVRHKAGEIRILCNCGVLTEGYDDPGISCIVLARPTKSPLLYTQMVGRGTRLQAGLNNMNDDGVGITKQNCVVIDVADNSSKHSLVSLSSIFGLGNGIDLKGESPVDAVDRIAAAQRQHPAVDLSKIKALDEIQIQIEKINLFDVHFAPEVEANSTFQWTQNSAKDSFVLVLPNETVSIVTDILGKFCVIGTVNGHDVSGKFNTLAEAFKNADLQVAQHGKELLNLLRRESNWHNDPATEKQLGLLRRLRIPCSPEMSKGQAAKLITQHMARHGKPFYMRAKKQTPVNPQINLSEFPTF